MRLPTGKGGMNFYVGVILAVTYLVFIGNIFAFVPSTTRLNIKVSDCIEKSGCKPYVSRTISRISATADESNQRDDSTKEDATVGLGNSDGSTNQLIDKASKLREEAELLQRELEEAKRSKIGTSRPQASDDRVGKSLPQPTYKQLRDSTWTVIYRFSSQPSKDDDGSDEGSSGEKSRNVYYSGSFNIYFKGDGYSELVSHEPTGGTSSTSNAVEIVKVWGWDKETSNDDGLDYILWSMDVKLPKIDPKLPSQTERFYLQARVDQNKAPQEGLSLKDGTITVKQDIADRTGGIWGLFSVKGILSEFKYVGEFATRPTMSATKNR